jgi:exopolyphosphatase/guanosine-5'-triphosphate,3'-diphosphate pyrophosphatase
MTRIAAIDIGSNSTRLLLADVSPDGQIDELSRESIVTRLADGVDSSGSLAGASMQRVFEAIAIYRDKWTAAGADAIGGVATSAVREAANGLLFAAELNEVFDAGIEVIGGDIEAELTFTGASSGGAIGRAGRVLVVDIGGGSTEFILGDDGELSFHVSTQIGAVRQSERFLHSDPPSADELAAMSHEIAARIVDAVPEEFRRGVDRGFGVAGTPTVLASVDQQLEVFDPWKVHGYAITAEACDAMAARLAALPLEERRNVTGLHPDRAPTIVAGAAILASTIRAFDLSSVTVSEHDLLYGIALQLAK